MFSNVSIPIIAELRRSSDGYAPTNMRWEGVEWGWWCKHVLATANIRTGPHKCSLETVLMTQGVTAPAQLLVTMTNSQPPCSCGDLGWR